MGSVSVLLVRPLAAAIGAGGPGPEALEALGALGAGTGLTAQLLADGDARLSPAQHAAAWAEALRVTGDRALPLGAAAAAPAGGFGLPEAVWRASSTLGEALRQWVRYLNLLDDTVSLGLEVEADRALLRVEREAEAPVPAARELRWALAARCARELPEAPVRPLAVELAHPAPADPAPFGAWFGAPVRFDAAATQLVLPREALAARLPPADPARLAVLARAADDLAARVAADPPMTQRVKRALPEALRADDAQVEAVAKQLGIAARTLQRRLRDEGTAFQSAREEVRRALAQRYLDAGLATSEIAFLLGLSEPGALARAFKRWTGLSPAESRALHLAALLA